MEFGSFRKHFLLVFLIVGINSFSQSEDKTASFLYNQLDQFLENPSSSSLLRLSKLTHSKASLLDSKESLLAWVIVNCNLGYYQNTYGNKIAAIGNYEKAWSVFDDNKLNNYDIIENCLKPLGVLYIQTGNLPKAETTIMSYLYLAQKSENKEQIIAAITNLSIAYTQRKNYPKSIGLLEEGLKIDPKNQNLIINLASNYLNLRDFAKANELASQAIAESENSKAYQIIAAVHLANQNYEQAIKNLNFAKEVLVRNDFEPREVALIEMEFVDVFLQQKKYTKANEHLKNVYSSLLSNYTAKIQLPSETDVIPDRILLNALDIQAEVFKKNKEPEKAIKAYNLSFTVYDLLNKEYFLQDTKLLSQGQNRLRTEKYLEVLYGQYTSSSDQSYLNLVFEIIEKTKSPLVRQALHLQNLSQTIQKDTLIFTYKHLRKQMANISTSLIKEKLTGDRASVTKIQSLSADYQKIALKFKEITQQVYQKYPVLFDTNTVLNCKQVQEKLKDQHTTLIEFFFGEKYIYQLIINKNETTLTRIENTAKVSSSIDKYISFFDDSSKILNDVIGYNAIAFDLYRILSIPLSHKRTIIIPDGKLCYIPFEALLTEKSKSINFAEIPFLLKSTQIGYEISASKYVSGNVINLKDKKILGIFPVFKNTAEELSYSILEKESIESYMKGTFFNEKEATYENFTTSANAYSILHLSTHAEAGSYNRPANISFFDQKILITALYGLNLKSELVILSACETGVGKRVKGEGPLSIGRGFQYTGVDNVLFSLWKVNDNATFLLIKNLYFHLSQKGIASEALHLAKLDYIKDKSLSNDQKSPYHWASFVYYGQPNEDLKSNFSIYLILTSVLILILALLVKNKFSKR